MKNYLLLIAAALVATTASAQEQKAKFMGTEFAGKVAPDYMNVFANEKKSATTTPAIHRAQGTAANPTAFYKRPKGTLYVGTDDRLYGFQNDMVVFPPTAPIVYQNASTNPSATTWYIGANALNSSNAGDMLDASNNLTWTYLPSQLTSEGISTYYAPLLINGADSFQLAPSVAPVSGNFDAGYVVFPINSSDLYYGGQGPSAYFGDMTISSTRSQVAFYQPFDAPIGSLTLNEISLYAWRNGGSITDAAKNMKVYIYNVVKDNQGNPSLGDTQLAAFTFVADSVKYTSDFSIGASGSTRALLTFYPLVDDGLGGQMIQPVDLNQEFAVLVTGFAGTNTGFFFAQAPDYMVSQETSDSYEFDSNAAPNARFLAQDTSDNQIYDYSYRYYMYPVIELHGYQNYTHFVESDTEEDNTVTSFTEFTAPVAGGVAVNDSGYVGQLYTALPWQDADGFDSYSINIDYGNETPWFEGLVQNEDGTYSITQVVATNSVDQSNSFVNTSYWKDNGLQVIGFRAQALPSGKSGRHAVVTVVANGYTSNKIVIRQGDDKTTVADGIKGISEDKKPVNNRIYNLSGQQVNQAYKGIVISNGKKYIQ